MGGSRAGRARVGVVAVIAAAIAGGLLWLQLAGPGASGATAALSQWWRALHDELPPGIATGNGRIEATEYDIATRRAGRVAEVLGQEGDRVEADQRLARMDTRDLEAQLREAQAQLREAREGRKYAQAIITQRESELAYARGELARSLALGEKGHVSKEQVDQHRMGRDVAEAALQAARVQEVQSAVAIEAAEARVERLQSDIDDSVLTSPVRGRVLYRLAEPGEVLGAGGKVLTVIDLSDVYMTIFLPTAQASRVTVGSEARIVLDAIPEYTIPARVSFVAARAQFTPKQVETRSEREKLMFRVKARIDPELLKKYVEKVKTGVPGVAYVRLGDDVAWPERLEVKLP